MLSWIGFVLLLCVPLTSYCEDSSSRLLKAVQRSTLDQPGTRPFHLKADLAASSEPNRSPDHSGTIEIWWSSPTEWKRDLKTPNFHLTEVTSGSKHWQHTDGGYFPEWLREIYSAILHPVPDFVNLSEKVKAAEVRTVLGMTHFSWMEFSSNGVAKKSMGAGIAINDQTGRLLYGSGFGWSFNNEEYSSFHNLSVARRVASSGLGAEVTARITILEDLDSNPAIFDTNLPDADPHPLHTVLLNELELRKNLLPPSEPEWPRLKDGPLEGVLTTEIMVDRTGRVRDIGTLVSDNPGLNDEAGKYIRSLQFQPYLVRGEPVQALSRLTLSFKTARPAGEETFDSARNYFEHARRLTSPAAGGNMQPYILHASFETKTTKGVQKGEYTDTWVSESEWCREAVILDSRYARCRNGEKWYLLAKGPDSPELQVVLKAIEPIPSADTFVESDWRINRQNVGGRSLIRVATGHESSDGVLDARSRGLWFDSEGLLVRSHFNGLDTVRFQFQEFHGVEIPQHIRILSNGQLAMHIDVTRIEPAANLSSAAFTITGHEWKRQFTDEAR